MFARNVSLRLKPNTLSEFTRIFDKEVISHAAEAEWVPG
jgi:hypothetical protein